MDLSRREFVASMSTLPVMPSLNPTKTLVIDAHVHAGHGTGITHESSTFLEMADDYDPLIPLPFE